MVLLPEVSRILYENEMRKLRRENAMINPPNVPLPPVKHPERVVRRNIEKCPCCKIKSPCYFHRALFKYFKAVRENRVKFMHFTRKLPEIVYNPLTFEPRILGEKEELIVIAEFDDYVLEFFFEEENKRTALVTVKTNEGQNGFVMPKEEAKLLLNPIKKKLSSYKRFIS